MGLRSGLLNNDEAIRLLSTMFVPVAVNLYEIRKDPGPAGALFRSVQRQLDTYQGWWIVSPEGKALKLEPQARPGFVMKEHIENSLKVMNDALKEWGPLKPRQVEWTDPLPYRGRGVKPDGGVSLAAYGRLVHQGKADGPFVLDSVDLGASEWAAFAPPGTDGAAEWTLPEGVARKMGCVITPLDDSAKFFDEDYLRAEVKARVESREGSQARIHLTASWRAKGVYGHEKGARVHEASSSGEGTAVYDTEKKAMRSLVLVFTGRWESRETGGVIEWSAEPPATKK
jgi:hypothetical protein